MRQSVLGIQIEISVMSIELRCIRLFLEVARHGAIRRAAGTLGLDEAAVSRTVKSLEDRLGVSLFERFSGGVRITGAGEIFLREGQAAIDIIDRAVANAGAAGRGETGAVRLGTVWSAAAGPANMLITEFLSKHPSVSIALTEQGPIHLANALLDRSIDLALLVGDLLPRSLSRHALWEEKLFFAVSVDAPLPRIVDWSLLVDRPLLVSASEDGNMLQRLVYNAGGPRLHVQAHDCSREAVLGLVASGAGMAITCESATLIPIPRVRFERIDAPHSVCTVCAAWLPENDNPALRRFISLIKTRYPHPP